MLYMPEREEMYSAEVFTKVSVRAVTETHCGASRPGHFDGVATVVCKLFNIVQPDMAFFGVISKIILFIKLRRINKDTNNDPVCLVFCGLD
jgi:pantoate--beta-alanine ligase